LHWHQEIEAEKPRFTPFAAGSELEHDDLASMHNCIRLERLAFHAELSTNGTERLELARV